MKLVLLVITAAWVTASSMVRADTSIPVTDFSFEIPAATFVTNNNPTAFPGFTINSPSYYGSQLLNGQFSNLGSATGNNYLFMNLDGPGTATATTATVTTIAANTGYTLTVALGNHLQTGAYGDPGDLTISLLANGTPIVGASTTVTNGTIANGYFVDYSASFSAATASLYANDNLTIQLATASGGQTQASFDNVRLTETPEPSTYAMMLGGLALLGFCVRRKLALVS